MPRNKGKKEGKKAPTPTKGKPATCQGCDVIFPSKNAVFRHLRETRGSCLSEEEYQAFLLHVVNSERNLEKIAVLYGYLPSEYYLKAGVSRTDTRSDVDDLSNPLAHFGVSGGDHAATLVIQAIERVSLGAAADSAAANVASSAKEKKLSFDNLYGKVNRSFGFNTRASSTEGILEQDMHTGALTELLCTSAPPLLGSGDDGTTKQELQKWIEEVNGELERLVQGLKGNMPKEAADCHPGEIRIFGRALISNKTFNAERDVTCRRVEYLIPFDFFVPTVDDESKGIRISKDDDEGDSISDAISERQFYFDSLPSFKAGRNTRISDDVDSIENIRPSPNMLKYLNRVKKLMQKMTTHTVELDLNDEAAVLEKDFATKSRKKQLNKSKKKRNDERSDKKRKQDDVPVDGTSNEKNKTESIKKGEREEIYKNAQVLKRKRYHNFSPLAMAHDFLSFRRMDRFYHKATIRYEEDPALGQNSRPYVLISLTGDTFLQGQARSVIGLLVAMCQGIIDEDIIDCVFDEDYPSLVPAPMLPRVGLYAAESQYMAWEGRLQTVLNARRNDSYKKGFCDEATNTNVENWRGVLNRQIAQAWCQNGVENGRLKTEQAWVEDTLEPWGRRANEQMKDYRCWKQAQQLVAENPGSSLVQHLLLPLDTADSKVPTLFAKVFKCLQDADTSGKWPSTTPKRQLVMVSTNEDGTAVSKSLSAAHMKAKANNVVSVSAYSLAEGQGGASGSFSVGAFPPSFDQPKANDIFPELMKAAFELEIALCPDREPSSTIAVNRNAQFRPHTDSGAGAGQSTSLIVGLGHYVGGELMVEGEKHDIRYKALTFNGWLQRHWTLPFSGERYSLVWFTPKGCEGIRGIDLCGASA